MPRYRCTDCGQTFWDNEGLEGNACNRCDEGWIEVVSYYDEEDDLIDIEDD